MKNNIRILYAISFFNSLWFWLGIWALYYLLFTNFSGIGIIEMAMIATIMLFEIPSGAFADIVGKKKTIILAFIVIALANTLMGLAVNFGMLLMSSVFISLGATMISGTFEAMTYDSLKALKKESLYNKVFSKQRSIVYVANALATISGGLLYTYVDPRAPFFAVAAVTAIACVMAFFLVEPPADTKKISLQGYRKQLKQGFIQIFSRINFRAVVLMLLVAGIIPLFMYEMLADLLLVAYGANAIEISIGVFIIFTVTAVIVNFSARISEKIGSLRSFAILSFIYGGLLLFVPFINLVAGIILLSALASISAINKVIQSDIINKGVPSEYRATSLSTFAMLLSVPYVLLAALLGYLSDKYSVQNVVFVLGLIMIILLAMSVLNAWEKNKKIN